MSKSNRSRIPQSLEKDKAHWKDTTWVYIKNKYPNAKVLISGQDFERPKTWPKYDDVSDIVQEFSVLKKALDTP